MKKIGETNEGNILVEMTRQEHHLMVVAAEALEGKIHYMLHTDRIVDSDMADFFVTLAHIASGLELANELSAYASHLRYMLTGKYDEQPKDDGSSDQG
jgi:hypothetical protein